MKILGKISFVIVLAGFLTTCQSEDNGVDVLTEFRIGPCEQSGNLFTIANGLQCVSWLLEIDGRLLLDFINFEAGCTPELEHLWEGYARFMEPDYLELGSKWKSKTPNACGFCQYKWSYNLHSVDAKAPLDVEMALKDCSQCPRRLFSMTLPTVVRPGGILCRYTPNLTSLTQTIEYGTLHMPPQLGTCEADLVIAFTLEGEQFCAATCTIDSDCPLQPLLSCQNSVCKITEPLQVR